MPPGRQGARRRGRETAYAELLGAERLVDDLAFRVIPLRVLPIPAMVVRGGAIVWVNASAERLGWGAPEVVGKTREEVLAYWDGQWRMTTSTGSVPVEVTEDALDQHTRILYVVRDPTRSLYAEVAEVRHGLANAARLLQPQRLGPVPGVNLAFLIQSAGVLGGDFVDFVQLDRGRIALVMGDASGWVRWR